MSGHSKWHSIKHQKAAADAKRGKIFTKLGNEIAVAARDGADPDMNFRLRLAIAKAKQNNMPASNIDRAIARGSGQGGGAALEELTYEGYGPAGVAIMVKALTDNRNRTASEVKSAFTRMGGNLGGTGSVAYLFDQKGVIYTKVGVNKDEIALQAIELGAMDIDDSGEQLIIYTKPSELERIKRELGDDVIEQSELELTPTHTVQLDDPQKATSLMKLIDHLDELDDVVSVSSNYDIPDEILANLV